MAGDKRYWQRRAAQRMWEQMQSAEQTADQIARLYANASQYLKKSIDGIFDKYQTKHRLSEREAKELLNALQNKASIRELQKKLQETSDRDERKDLLSQLEAPAYRARIERLERLQGQIDLVMNQVYRQERKLSAAHYVDLAEDVYNHAAFDIQQRTGMGFPVTHISQNQIDKVVNSKWSGKNYSSRIWGNTQALARDLKEELLMDLVSGRTERETAEILSKKFGASASKARRLVRTESCYISNQMEMQSYKECGIEKYQYLATLDLRTSEACRALDGRIFLVSEQQVGKNCPPMHPWCRSTTIAYISADVMAGMKRRARDPVTGKLYEVPGDMNYQEWYAKYVEKSSNPAIIRVEKTTLTAEPNTVTEVIGKKGGIDRNYYGPDGRQQKQISNNNHGNPKLHPFGKHGEHAHDYIYAEDGRLKGRPVRELTDEERKENEDIL